jgi:hypothetical protein
LSTGAKADEFMNLCKAGNPIDNVDKFCSCVAGKVSDADKPAAITAMTKMNDAMTKGGTVDQSIMTPEVQKGFMAVSQAEAACLQ